MLNPLSFITKFIKSSNQRELDRISKIVSKINSLEEDVKKLDDSEFPKKTLEFKEKIRNGEKLEKIYVEKNYKFLLIYPNRTLSTKLVFDNFDFKTENNLKYMNFNKIKIF